MDKYYKTTWDQWVFFLYGEKDGQEIALAAIHGNVYVASYLEIGDANFKYKQQLLSCKNLWNFYSSCINVCLLCNSQSARYSYTCFPEQNEKIYLYFSLHHWG